MGLDLAPRLSERTVTAGALRSKEHESVAPFRPLPFLRNPHLQTILGRASWGRELFPSVHHLIGLEDGDKLAVVVSTPAGWEPEDRTAVLVHGLCGCYQSAYVSRMAGRLFGLGLRVVRVNLRGCGSGRGLARHPYHSGRSEDVRQVLTWLNLQWPESPVALLGYSLGGNIVLKMAGEDGHVPTGSLDSVIAVSAPIDLLACSQLIEQPRNRLYDRHFVKLLIMDVRERQRFFPDLPDVSLPPQPTLRQFDDTYTAPRSGFRDAVDYYERASSGPLIGRIEVPTLLLTARDDPFIAVDPFERVPDRRHIEVHITDHGGHLGFLGFTSNPWKFRWMDDFLVDWILRRQGHIHPSRVDLCD